MNGAQALVRTAAQAGVGVCFANPGTTEMPLVQALDEAGGLRPVLGLFEGVCTGAADGYGRMARMPALTLLHLGPGLANGLANLHNARRARTPIVNVVGDHATHHLPLDAPLTSDIAGLARPVSVWVATAGAAGSVAAETATAIAAARGGAGAPPGPATLIVPADAQWGEGGDAAAAREPGPPPAPSDEAVAQSATALRADDGGVLLLGGPALTGDGQRAAAAIGAATGWRVLTETFPARMERGAGVPPLDKLPYFPEQALDALAGPGVVLAGAVPPVAFFAYPGQPGSTVPPGTPVVELAGPDHDAEAALLQLADALGVTVPGSASAQPAPHVPDGDLDILTVGAVVAALQPPDAIVVDEAVTSGLGYFGPAGGAPAHSYLALTGGSIGYGLPAAAGAAIACPERPVIALQADGSALYTPQALWTMARERLDVTVVLCANRRYQILEIELMRAGAAHLGPAAKGLTDLGDPDPDWVSLAAGLGVPGARARTCAELADAMRDALAAPGPHLIEAVL